MFVGFNSIGGMGIVGKSIKTLQTFVQKIHFKSLYCSEKKCRPLAPKRV